MDEKKLAAESGSPDDTKDKVNMPNVAGVYPTHQKMTAEDVADIDARKERERIKAQWEAQKVKQKQDERKKAEDERQKAEREALYRDLDSFDYDLLSLREYPTDFEIETARRARLGWFMGLGFAVFLFTSSLLNLIDSWVGGIAGGVAFVLWLSHGTGMLSILPGLSRHPELLAKRRRIKNQVTEYIQHIEGKRGYIHRIYPLVHHNARLRARKFRRIALMSKEHTIISNIKTLQDVALYNEYLEEAKKAAQEYFLREAEDKLLADEGIDPDVEDLEVDLHEQQGEEDEEGAVSTAQTDSEQPAEDQTSKKPTHLKPAAKDTLKPASIEDSEAPKKHSDKEA